MTVGFEQATIKVERPQEYSALQAAVERAFVPDRVEQYLKLLDRKGIRVRDFDAVLAQRALEEATGASNLKATELYQALTLSDQAQMRELYLSKLETVDQALRHKFRKLYQYY